jgi:hypothetical protein
LRLRLSDDWIMTMIDLLTITISVVADVTTSWTASQNES